MNVHQGSATSKRRDLFRVTPAQLARAQRWPIGQPVTVTKDDGSTLDTVTRSNPWKLGATWVLMVDGISGGYALARIAPRAENADPARLAQCVAELAVAIAGGEVTPARGELEVSNSLAFLADLNRLLREGLVRVDQDDTDAPRFDLTLRGRAYTTTGDPAPLRDEAQTSAFIDADEWVAS